MADIAKKTNELFENYGYKFIVSWYSTLENEEKEYIPLESDNGVIPIWGKGCLYCLKK